MAKIETLIFFAEASVFPPEASVFLQKLQFFTEASVVQDVQRPKLLQKQSKGRFGRSLPCSIITHSQRFGAEHGHGGVVHVDVDEGVGELHGGVGLVVHVVVLPRHQLARRRLSRPRRTGEPEDLALLPGVGLDVGTAGVNYCKLYGPSLYKPFIK